MPSGSPIPTEGLPPGVRRSGSGRIPQWAIDEAFGALQDPAPWRTGPSAHVPVPAPAFGRRRRRLGRKWVIGAGIALLAGLSAVPMAFERIVLPAVLPYLPGAPVPPPGFEAAGAPLGQPPASTGSKAYALQESPDPGQPFAAYDPCRPVHYVVRPNNAPPGADQMIQEAVARVSAATGLRFVYDGPTSEAPSDERETYQPDLYGKRWAPVLIAWSNPSESPDLAGDVDGLGGSGYAYVEGQPYVLVAGQVALDAPDFADILQWPDGSKYGRAVIMHELAHVVGLDHVNDPTQLMNPEGTGVTEFAAGDLAGLSVLGGGECVPEL